MSSLNKPNPIQTLYILTYLIQNYFLCLGRHDFNKQRSYIGRQASCHDVLVIVSSWNFQELLPLTKLMTMQKVKVRSQRSRSERSKPNLAVSGLNSSLNSQMAMKWCRKLDVGPKIANFTQIGNCGAITPVSIHWWWWNDAQSLKLHRRGALLFFKCIRQISKSHRTKNCRF